MSVDPRVERAWVWVQELARRCKGCPRRGTAACERCAVAEARRIVDEMPADFTPDEVSDKALREPVRLRRMELVRFLRECGMAAVPIQDLPHDAERVYKLHDDVRWLERRHWLKRVRLGGVVCVALEGKGADRG